MMNLTQQLIDLGYDPLFAERSAKEIIELGATLEEFEAFVAHVHLIAEQNQAIHNRYQARRQMLAGLLRWTRSKSLLAELAGLLVMSPIMLPLSLLVRLACWWSLRRVRKRFCPWFREWVKR